MLRLLVDRRQCPHSLLRYVRQRGVGTPRHRKPYQVPTRLVRVGRRVRTKEAQALPS